MTKLKMPWSWPAIFNHPAWPAKISLRYNGKRGHIVAHDVSWAAQTGKHLLRTQNVSEQNQKHFLCPRHKICVRNKCCPRGQTGIHLCRQQCVHNNVSSIARAFTVSEKSGNFLYFGGWESLPFFRKYVFYLCLCLF